jgi:predicted P-loop ATPase
MALLYDDRDEAWLKVIQDYWAFYQLVITQDDWALPGQERDAFDNWWNACERWLEVAGPVAIHIASSDHD